MKDLSGKCAFVTGAASGIGLAMARAFAEAGMNLVLADIEAGALAAAKKDIAGRGAAVTTALVDVTDRAAMRRAADAAQDAFGNVHVLCNNAGVAAGGPLQAARDEDWDWVLAVNLGGVVNGLQAFLPAMVAHGEAGHIVNTGSVAGLYPMTGTGIYNASKYAVVGLSESLRDDLAETALGVSVLCPGFVRTRILESQRNRAARFGTTDPVISSAAKELIQAGSDPDEIGRLVRKAILADDFYIISHPEFSRQVGRRQAAVTAAFDKAGQG